MKTWVAVLMLCGVLSMGSGAVARAGPFDGALFSTQSQGSGESRGSSHDKQPFRDARNAQQPPQQPRGVPRGQLTPDERRQLHRDLDKANRELYSGNRRRSIPAD